MDSVLDKFYGLDEASEFFLDNAFRYINDAFYMERTHKIFASNIMEIGLPEDWTIPKLPSSIREMLNYDGEILPDEKISELSTCWKNSQIEALQRNDIRFEKEHEVKSIEIVGHILNLHAFVETTLNRHLYLLKIAGNISGDIFNSLDRTEFIPKLLYIFKDEVLRKQIQIQPFRTLNKLRNSAVHFKKDSRNRIKPLVTELLVIWREIDSLLHHITKDSNENTISNYTNNFVETFLEIKS